MGFNSGFKGLNYIRHATVRRGCKLLDEMPKTPHVSSDLKKCTLCSDIMRYRVVNFIDVLGQSIVHIFNGQEIQEIIFGFFNP